MAQEKHLINNKQLTKQELIDYINSIPDELFISAEIPENVFFGHYIKTNKEVRFVHYTMPDGTMVKEPYIVESLFINTKPTKESGIEPLCFPININDFVIKV